MFERDAVAGTAMLRQAFTEKDRPYRFERAQRNGRGNKKIKMTNILMTFVWKMKEEEQLKIPRLSHKH